SAESVLHAKIGELRWSAIFCPVRSVASVCRAPNVDRPRGEDLDRAPVRVARSLPLAALLPAAAGAGSRSAADPSDRRAASCASVPGGEETRRAAAARRLRGRLSTRGHAHAPHRPPCGDRFSLTRLVFPCLLVPSVQLEPVSQDSRAS